MAEFKIRPNKRELMLLYIIMAIFVSELLVLMIVLNYAKFPLFVSLFVKALKILSPIFLSLNVMFLIYAIVVKRRRLIAPSWKEAIGEFSRFIALSFAITLALIIVSAFLGVLFELILDYISNLPATKSLMNYLRDWVDRNFY